MMLERGQVWERDGHRVELIDRRLDACDRIYQMPVYLVVSEERGWHEDVISGICQSRRREYWSAGPLIARDTLLSEWTLVTG